MIRTGILKYLKIIVSDMVDDNGEYSDASEPVNPI